MARNPEILENLKFELDFIEDGGYGRSVRTPWKPTCIFEDTITCINFGEPERSRRHEGCLLMDFVPTEKRSESVPCHHIPLNDAGESIDQIEARRGQEEALEAVKIWLRKKISQLELERTR
jgi:hypothetical protein